MRVAEEIDGAGYEFCMSSQRAMLVASCDMRRLTYCTGLDEKCRSIYRDFFFFLFFIYYRYVDLTIFLTFLDISRRYLYFVICSVICIYSGLVIYVWDYS